MSLAATSDETPARATTSNVQLTATPTGGANAEYKFALYKGTDIVPVAQRDFDTWSSWLWVPETQGTYKLQVTARELGTTTPEFTGQVLNYQVLPRLLSGVTLAVDLTAPQLTNTDITLTATPTGGTSPEYRFEVYKDAETTPTAYHDFDTPNSWIWTPTADGSYKLKAIVRETGTTEPAFNAEKHDYTVLQELSGVSISVDPDTTPQPNQTPITLTATALGGMNLQYRFEVYASTDLVTPVAVQDYQAPNAWVWTPTAAGTYRLRAFVRETYPGREATRVADRESYVIQ